MKNLIILIVCVCFISILNTGNTNATQYTWTGNVSTAWTTAGNWSSSGPSGTPGATDTVTIVTDSNQCHLTANTTIGRLTLTSGTLQMNGYTLTINTRASFNGGTVYGTANNAVKPRGTRNTFAGTVFNAEVETIGGQIELSGSTFNDTCYFELTGINSGQGNGGNTFNKPVTIVKSGNTYWNIANNTGNTFNDDVTFTNTSGHEIIASDQGTTYFNDNIVVNSTGGDINFGTTTSTVTLLADEKTITIGATGFSSGSLLIRNLNTGADADIDITLTGSAILNVINCLFQGTSDFTAPAILLKGNYFLAAASFKQTGSASTLSEGGNLFVATTFENSGAGGFRLTTNSNDSFFGNVTLNATSTGKIQFAYVATAYLYGNLSANSMLVEYGTNNGILNFAGEAQSINGTLNNIKNMTVNKASNSLTLNTPVTITGTLTLINGVIATTATNLLTMNSGSIVSGGNDTSYVNGPVKKIGNTVFVFPTGKGSNYRPLEMSAPSVNSNAYTAEYFNSGQSLGSSMDGSMKFIHNCSYWSFTRNSGSSNVTVKLSWDSSACGLFDSASVKVANWNGSTWKDLGNGGITGNKYVGKVANSATVVTYGYFALGYNMCFLTANAGTDQSICSDSVTIGGTLPAGNGMAPYIYSWSPSAGLSSTTTANPEAKPSTITDYIVTVNDAAGCSKNDTITVSLFCPLLNFTMSEDTVIIGDTVIFTNASTGFPANTVYAWNYMDQCAGDTGAIFCIDSITGELNAYHKFKFFGTYYIELSAKDVNDSLLIFRDTLIVMPANYNQSYVTNCDLVINGDFESTNFCPHMEFVTYPTSTFANPLAWGAPVGWSNLTYTGNIATPDYFLTKNCIPVTPGCSCCNTPNWVPCNPAGYQLSYNGGNAYAGILVDGGNLIGRSEYITTMLTAPMVANVTYTVSMYVSRDNAHTSACIGLGFLLTSSPLPPQNNSNIIAGAQYADITLITDQTLWTQVTFNFTASGGERYLTIGAFISPPSITLQPVVASGCTASPCSPINTNSYGAYYYIDGVSVTLPAISVTITATGNFCIGGSVTLNAGAGYSQYLWSTGATTQTINVTTSSTYTVTVTDASGCTATDDIVVNFTPAFSASITGTLSFCSGSSTTLIANPSGLTYQWSPGGATTQAITVNTAGTYTVTVTDANGCTGTASVPVTVNPSPTPNGGSVSICQGNNTVLNPGGGFTSYLWSLGGATTQTITASTAGTYTVTVTDNNGCTGSNTFVVTVIPLSSANISGNSTICTGSSSSFSISFTGTGPWTYSYSNGSTTFGPFVSSSSPVSISVSPTATTTYTLVNLSAGGCNGTISGTAIVTVKPLPPVPVIQGNAGACNTNPVYSVTPVSGITYTWSTSWSQSGTGSTTISLTIPSGGGTITFIATDPSTGCTSQSTFTIYPCCEIPAPNPNDWSGLNVSDVLSNIASYWYCGVGPIGELEVSANYIYPASNPSYSHLTEVVINGTFNVDNNAEFYRCRIVLGPDAVITIQPGFYLSFLECYISACENYMWKEISIPNNAHLIMEDTRVDDGQNAINSVNGGRFSVNECYFNRNWISVLVNPYAGNHLGRCLSSVFETVSLTNPLQWADNCLPPHQGQRGHRGYEINGVSNIQIGDPNSLAFRNTFFHLDQGIHSNASSVTIKNNFFDHITIPSATSTAAGIAIQSTGGGVIPAPTLTVGGSGLDVNDFRECGHGVYSKRVNLSVIGNHFDFIRNSFFSPTLQSYACRAVDGGGVTVNIFDNYFNNCGWLAVNGSGTGIFIRDLVASTITIQNNFFNASIGANGNRAIGLQSSGLNEPIPNNTLITGNTILESRVGIGLINYYNANISATNTITMPDAYVAGNYYGIRLENSHNNVILENIVKRLNNPLNNTNFTQHVFAISNEGSDFNKIMSNNLKRAGAGMRYFNSGLNYLQCNELEHNIVGVRIVNSNLGAQGAPTVAQDNSWIDFISTDMDIRGQGPTYYNATWHSQPGYPPYFVPSNKIFPFLIPGTSNVWIDFQNATSNNSCTNPLRGQQQEEMANIVTEEGDFYLLDDNEKYKLKKGVFVAIYHDTTWMYLNTSNDTILQNFYDSVLTTPMGQLEIVRDTIEIDTAAAAAIVSSLSPDNIPEENELTVQEIYLVTLAREIYEFTPVQYQILYDIAVQSPITGGRAVYWARVLLQLEVDDFYEDIIGGRFTEPKYINLSKAKRKGKLFPNPANEFAFYEIDLTKNETGKLMLFNFYGEKQKEYNFNEGENKVQIDLKNLNAGLFIYKVEINGLYSENGKLIVIH